MTRGTHEALDDLLTVHTERIQLALRRQVGEFEWSEEKLIGLQLEWGMIGRASRFLVPGSDCDQILFLRAIVFLPKGILIPLYIPVRDIDPEAGVFTDEQLCRKEP